MTHSTYAATVHYMSTAATTPFGSITIDEHNRLTLTATNHELYSWSHRTGASWPCSTLDDCEMIRAEFESNGDLVDIEHPGMDDVAGDEMSAWTTDVLDAAGVKHPASR